MEDEGKDVQPLNAEFSIVLRPLGNTTFDKDVTTGTDIALNGEQSQITLSKEEDGIIILGIDR